MNKSRRIIGLIILTTFMTLICSDVSYLNTTRIVQPDKTIKSKLEVMSIFETQQGVDAIKKEIARRYDLELEVKKKKEKITNIKEAVISLKNTGIEALVPAIGDFYGYIIKIIKLKGLSREIKDQIDKVDKLIEPLLKAVEDERVIEPLIKILKDKNKNVRTKAVAELASLAKEPVIESLIKALKVNDVSVGESEVQNLRKLGNINFRILLAFLLDELGDDDAGRMLVEVIHRIKRLRGNEQKRDNRLMIPVFKIQSSHVIDTAVALKNKFLRDNRIVNFFKAVPYVRRYANIAPEDEFLRDNRIVNLLLKALSNEHLYVRRYAAVLLYESGNEGLVEPLIKMLKVKDVGIEESEVQDLRKLGNIDFRILLAFLLDELGDDDAGRILLKVLIRKTKMRRRNRRNRRKRDNRIMTPVSRIQSRNARDAAIVPRTGFLRDKIVNLLPTALMNKNPYVRRDRAISPRNEFLTHRRIVNLLLKALSNKHLYVRRDAAMLLYESGNKGLVEPLIKMLKVKDVGIEESEVQDLRKLGNIDFRILLAFLLDELGDDDAGRILLKVLIRKTKMRRGNERKRDNRLATPEFRIQSRNARDAGIVPKNEFLRDNRIVNLLLKALSNNNPHVRRDAAILLGESGDKQAVEPLIETLEDNDKFVMIKAANALIKIGDPSVVPLIKRLDIEKGYKTKISIIKQITKKPILQLLFDNYEDKEIDTMIKKVLLEKESSFKKEIIKNMNIEAIKYKEDQLFKFFELKREEYILSDKEIATAEAKSIEETIIDKNLRTVGLVVVNDYINKLRIAKYNLNTKKGLEKLQKDLDIVKLELGQSIEEIIKRRDMKKLREKIIKERFVHPKLDKDIDDGIQRIEFPDGLVLGYEYEKGILKDVKVIRESILSQELIKAVAKDMRESAEANLERIITNSLKYLEKIFIPIIKDLSFERYMTISVKHKKSIINFDLRPQKITLIAA